MLNKGLIFTNDVGYCYAQRKIKEFKKALKIQKIFITKIVQIYILTPESEEI